MSRDCATGVAAAAPALAAAVAVALFWLLRTPPPNYDCGEDQVVSDATITAYRSGLVPLHVLVGIVALVGIIALSRARMVRAGRARSLGRPTVIAVLLLVLLAVLTATDWRSGLILMWMGAIVVAMFGSASATAAALVAVAALVAGGIELARRAGLGRRGAGLGASALAWAVLLLAPGHALVVYLQGDGPLFC